MCVDRSGTYEQSRCSISASEPFCPIYGPFLITSCPKWSSICYWHGYICLFLLKLCFNMRKYARASLLLSNYAFPYALFADYATSYASRMGTGLAKTLLPFCYNNTVRAVLMGTKSCTKILNFSTRFSCENLAVEDFVTLLMGKKSC